MPRLHSIILLSLLAAARAPGALLDDPVKGAPAGFLEGRLTRPALVRVENPRTGRYRLRMLGAPTRVELVHPPSDTDQEVRALLSDGATVFLPPAKVELNSETSTWPRERLLDRGDERSHEPLRNLPLGVRYLWMVRGGARLHFVSLDLAANPGLEFLPVTTGKESPSSRTAKRRPTRRRRMLPVEELAHRTGALMALNGPFFIPTGSSRGEPLGALVAGGKILHQVEDEYVLGLERTYLAWTNAGRFVMGETTLPAGEIMRRNQAGVFAREQLGETERILSLVGGMGRLVRDSDPEAWRMLAGRQFGAQYYGRAARRPQALVGLADQGRRLLILVQEGYPHSDRCYTLPELGHVLADLGAEEVAFNDGGGSAELVLGGRAVVRTENAAPRRPNSTILVVRERS